MAKTPEYADYATKAITPTMEAFYDFLVAEVFGGKAPESFDLRSVALGGSLRSQFQKSEFWKADPRNYLSNVEANRAAKATARADAAKAALAKANARVAKAEADAKAAVAAAKAKADAANAKAKAA